jgi:hypothetical protein
MTAEAGVVRRQAPPTLVTPPTSTTAWTATWPPSWSHPSSPWGWQT